MDKVLKQKESKSSLITIHQEKETLTQNISSFSNFWTCSKPLYISIFKIKLKIFGNNQGDRQIKVLQYCHVIYILIIIDVHGQPQVNFGDAINNYINFFTQ